MQVPVALWRIGWFCGRKECSHDWLTDVVNRNDIVYVSCEHWFWAESIFCFAWSTGNTFLFSFVVTQVSKAVHGSRKMLWKSETENRIIKKSMLYWMERFRSAPCAQFTCTSIATNSGNIVNPGLSACDRNMGVNCVCIYAPAEVERWMMLCWLHPLVGDWFYSGVTLSMKFCPHLPIGDLTLHTKHHFGWSQATGCLWPLVLLHMAV